MHRDRLLLLVRWRCLRKPVCFRSICGWSVCGGLGDCALSLAIWLLLLLNIKCCWPGEAACQSPKQMS